MGGRADSTKTSIRRAMRARREQLAPDVLRAIAGRICSAIVSGSTFRDAAGVCMYAALPWEPDLTGLDLVARAEGKAVYYPRIERGELVFCQATADDLIRGAFGVPEPPSGSPALAAGAAHVLYLVPGLSFDCYGTRLGSGAGYYDRALATSKGVYFGVVPATCIVERLPRDVWDVPMHAVVTEDGLLTVRTSVGTKTGDQQWT